MDSIPKLIAIRRYLRAATTARGFEGHVLYNPGDQVESVHFPCGGSAVALVIAIDDGRELDAALIGREGAAGGIVSHGSLAAFSRITVRLAGPFARLPVARLKAAKG
jgi:hypothetical protein